MDSLIETLAGAFGTLIGAVAGGLGGAIGWLAENGVLFLVFAVLWIAFGVAIVWSQGSIDAVWQTIRGWPLIVQLGAWLLLLPVIAGLWIWETSWPLLVRVTLVLGLAGWNLLVFLPKALQAARP